MCCLLSNLTVSGDDVFVRTQLVQSHGSPGVEFLGGNAHFAAQAEFSAVGKARGDVHIDGGAVYTGREAGRPVWTLGDDGLAVTGGVGGNVRNGGVRGIHDTNGKNVIQEFRIKVLGTRRSAGDDGGCRRVQPQLHRNQPMDCPVLHQRLPEHRQELPGHGPVDKARRDGWFWR